MLRRNIVKLSKVKERKGKERKGKERKGRERKETNPTVRNYFKRMKTKIQ